jgi:hypothetical protein
VTERPGDVMIVHVVVYVNEDDQKFRTEVEINEELPEVLRLVGAAHAARDLLNKLGPDVL